MKVAYLDSSVALRLKVGGHFMEHSRAVIAWLRESETRLVSSELLQVEVHRTLFREFGSSAGAQDLVDNFHLLALDHQVIHDACSIPHNIRTLDALHIATALPMVGDDMAFVSTDEQQLAVASKMGLVTINATYGPPRTKDVPTTDDPDATSA